MVRAKNRIFILVMNEKTEDFSLSSEYRFDLGFVIGYVLLFAGLLIFEWDPHYIFLGLAIELAVFILGYQVQSFIASGVGAFITALILSAPAFLLILWIAVLPPLNFFLEGNMAGWAGLGILLFLISSLHGSFQRFCRTSLRTARFYRHLNHKYAYESGKPVLSGFSLVLGSLAGTWVAAITFLICLWLVSHLGSYTHAAAIAMSVLCLFRQLAVMVLVKLAAQSDKNQESAWLDILKKNGAVHLREHPVNSNP